MQKKEIINKYEAREQREAEELAAEEAKAAEQGKKVVRYSYIKSVTNNDKTKHVNFMCSPNLWKEFTAICKEYGITNSSCLNQLMTRFVKGEISR